MSSESVKFSISHKLSHWEITTRKDSYALSFLFDCTEPSAFSESQSFIRFFKISDSQRFMLSPRYRIDEPSLKRQRAIAQLV